jgi:hypothetical protein
MHNLCVEPFNKPEMIKGEMVSVDGSIINFPLRGYPIIEPSAATTVWFSALSESWISLSRLEMRAEINSC